MDIARSEADGVTALNSVYLCGPINGRSDDDCRNWREQAKEFLFPLTTLDPMRRDFRGRELEPGINSQIVELDKIDVLSSFALLAYTDQPSDGTAMEILLAWMHHVPVYVVNKRNRPLSPWIIYHATELHSNLESACKAILR